MGWREQLWGRPPTSTRVCPHWPTCWGHWQNTDLTSPTGTPASPISSRIQLVSVCRYQGYKSHFSVKSADFHSYKSQNAHSRLDPYWFDLQTEVFFCPAYCISIIILLLRLTCSMLLSKTSHDETEQMKPHANLIRPWGDSVEKKSFFNWGIVILAWWECTYKILHQFDKLEDTVVARACLKFMMWNNSIFASVLFFRWRC